MPFFEVLPVDVQRTFRLLTDEQHGGNLCPITSAKRAYLTLLANSRLTGVIARNRCFAHWSHGE